MKSGDGTTESTRLLGHSSRQLKWYRCILQTFLKHFYVLLVFHLLNAATALIGVFATLCMLISVILMPVRVGMVLAKRGMMWMWTNVSARLSNANLHVILVIGLIGSFVLAYWNFVVLLCLFVPGILNKCGVSLFNLSIAFVHCLVRVDVDLVCFVDPAIVINELVEINDLQLDPRNNSIWFSNWDSMVPHLKMTKKEWAVAFYFAFIKPLIGMVSAIVVTFTVIQPIIALLSCGKATNFPSQATLSEEPMEYLLLILLFWIAGAVELFISTSIFIAVMHHFVEYSECIA
ncbi:unnamed protein product [Peronospora belbahrii]|uniref:Transmembrane protein n=1 Tax=Peronospora belbahrii TaxID=622444 RepID=A0AAU9L5A5_9STRA|nr:unnamed protein product [Peronospora belbahrii]